MMGNLITFFRNTNVRREKKESRNYKIERGKKRCRL